MSSINRIKEKYNIDYIDLILILSPFIDLLIRFLTVNYKLSMISNLFRGAILFCVLAYIFFIKKEKNFKLMLYLCLIFGYIILFLLNEFLLFPDGIRYEIIGVIKYMFYPLMVAGLLIINNDKKRHNILFLSAVLYSLFLIIPLIIGKGSHTYGGSKLGNIGWFYSPNEISAIVGILSPFVFLKIFDSNNNSRKIIYLLISFVYIYSIFSIGTKTPIVSVLVSLVMSLFCIIYNIFASKQKIKYIRNLLSLIILLAFSILIFINSNTFKNLSMHDEIYKYMENISDEFGSASDKKSSNGFKFMVENGENYCDTEIKNDNLDYIYDLLNKKDLSQNSDYKTNKFTNLILSSRDIYLHDTFEKYTVAPASEKLFGMGILQDSGINNTSKAIEIDFLDILFNYGIIGFALYFGFVFYLIFKIAKRFICSFKSSMSNDIKCAYFESMVICICVSTLSGHILSAPAVSLFAAVVLSSLFDFDNRVEVKKNFWIKENILKIAKCSLILILIFGVSVFLNTYFKMPDLVINDNDNGIIFHNYNATKKDSKTIESKFVKDIIDYYYLDKNGKIVATAIVFNRFINEEKYRYITIKSNIYNLHVVVNDNNNDNLSSISYKYSVIANKCSLLLKNFKKRINIDKGNDTFLTKNEYFDYGHKVFDNYIISDNDIMYKDYINILNNLGNDDNINYHSNIHSLISYGIKNNSDLFMLYELSFEDNKIVVKYYYDENYDNKTANLKEGEANE